MKNLHFLFLFGLLLFGVSTPSVHGQVLLKTDFADGDLQGWVQSSTSMGPPFAFFGTRQIASDPDDYVLRLDNTVSGTGKPKATRSFAAQTEGVLQFSLSIRFLDEGGVGTRYNVSNLQLSIQGATTGTYVQLGVGSNVKYRSSNGTLHDEGSVEIQCGVWYDVVQTLDLSDSTYSFTIQNRSDPNDFFQSETVKTYYKVTEANQVVIGDQGSSRFGLYEVDHVKVEIIPEPTVGLLGFLGLATAGSLLYYRGKRK